MKITAFLCILSPLVFSYGRLGHQLSGSLTQALLSPAALDYTSVVLKRFDGSLARASTWADEIKSKRSYDWAKPLHYVNPVKYIYSARYKLIRAYL
jgi:hypothetical protein